MSVILQDDTQRRVPQGENGTNSGKGLRLDINKQQMFTIWVHLLVFVPRIHAADIHLCINLFV